MKKLSIALLAAALLISAVSCGKNEPKPADKPDTAAEETVTPEPEDNTADETADETEGEDEDEDEEPEEVVKDEAYYLSELSTDTFDGYNYRILVRKGSLTSQFYEEPQEDAVADSIYKRNRAVEERFGITVTCLEGSTLGGGGTDTSALNSILAGDDSCDIIFTHSRSAFSYAVQGAAMNIHEIDTIHINKPWWSKNIDDNCTINGRLYVLDGDISIDGLSSAMCMLFNKRIFDELGYDYPYEMVLDGEWTFDQFAYLAKKGGKDLDGDGVMIAENDQFGFDTREWEAPINILYAGSKKVYDKNEEGDLELTLYSPKTVQIFDSFFSLMNNESCFLQFTEGNVNYSGTNMFKDGRSMMTSAGLGGAQAYRDMDDDFGIIPYPKFDEDDEYHTAINGHAPLAVIPITVSDPERTGAITEALAAYGSMYVLPAFYDVSLKTKYARDEESEEMMDIIKDSIIFDIGYLCGGQYQSHGRDISKLTNRDFSSWYSARESAAKSDLAKFNRDYGGIEE